MITLYLRLSLLLAVICAVVIALALAFGSTRNTATLTALVTRHPRGWIDRSTVYRLIDLRTGLTVDRRLPDAMRGINRAILQERTVFGSAEIIRQEGTKDHRLLMFDPQSDVVARLDTKTVRVGMTAWRDHQVTRSPDGRSLAFVSPERNRVYIYDLASGERTPFGSHGYVMSRPNESTLYWSDSGTKLAYIRSTHLVSVATRDGQRQDFDVSSLGTDPWRIMWQRDRFILGVLGADPEPVYVYDNGELVQHAVGRLAGIADGGCDLVYVAPDQRLYPIDSDTPLLDGLAVERVDWSPDCRWLVAYNSDGVTLSDGDAVRHLPDTVRVDLWQNGGLIYTTMTGAVVHYDLASDERQTVFDLPPGYGRVALITDDLALLVDGLGVRYRLHRLDINSGRVTSLTQPGETVIDLAVTFSDAKNRVPTATP